MKVNDLRKGDASKCYLSLSTYQGGGFRIYGCGSGGTADPTPPFVAGATLISVDTNHYQIST